MKPEELDNKLCKSCNEPLFVDKNECKSFIENKLKQGYIVCSCCGGRTQ